MDRGELAGALTRRSHRRIITPPVVAFYSTFHRSAPLFTAFHHFPPLSTAFHPISTTFHNFTPLFHLFYHFPPLSTTFHLILFHLSPHSTALRHFQPLSVTFHRILFNVPPVSTASHRFLSPGNYPSRRRPPADRPTDSALGCRELVRHRSRDPWTRSGWHCRGRR